MARASSVNKDLRKTQKPRLAIGAFDISVFDISVDSRPFSAQTLPKSPSQKEGVLV
jgi:hypothetical protein